MECLPETYTQHSSQIMKLYIVHLHNDRHRHANTEKDMRICPFKRHPLSQQKEKILTRYSHYENKPVLDFLAILKISQGHERWLAQINLNFHHLEQHHLI